MNTVDGGDKGQCYRILMPRLHPPLPDERNRDGPDTEIRREDGKTDGWGTVKEKRGALRERSRDDARQYVCNVCVCM